MLGMLGLGRACFAICGFSGCICFDARGIDHVLYPLIMSFLSSNMMVFTTLDAIDPLQMDLVLETLPIQS